MYAVLLWAVRKLAILLWALRKVAESYEELMAPERRPSRVYFRPSLEGLEERWCPAAYYWDPTSGNNATTLANWDLNSLGSGIHPTMTPGDTNGQTDNIYFNGSTTGGNNNCTWDYTPVNPLGSVIFQSGWNHSLSFTGNDGFSVSSTSLVASNASPTLKPNGASLFPAITLTNGVTMVVNSGCTLKLQGWTSGGNAIFFAGDGTAGEFLYNKGTVTYQGEGNSGTTPYVDYLKIPVENNGIFNVNGNIGSFTTGSALQVSGSDSSTGRKSFYQNTATGTETDIYGNGTLWCVNDYWMIAGLFQTTDALTENLEVGTGGSSPVDGTAIFSGGTVNINPNGSGTTLFGTLDILGTTTNNAPTLDVGLATLNFKVGFTSTQAPDGVSTPANDKLIVGNTVDQGNMKGNLNFGYNNVSATLTIKPQGTVSSGDAWDVIYFGSVTNTNDAPVTAGYTPTWETHDLKITKN